MTFKNNKTGWLICSDEDLAELKYNHTHHMWNINIKKIKSEWRIVTCTEWSSPWKVRHLPYCGALQWKTFPCRASAAACGETSCYLDPQITSTRKLQHQETLCFGWFTKRSGLEQDNKLRNWPKHWIIHVLIRGRWTGKGVEIKSLTIIVIFDVTNKCALCHKCLLLMSNYFLGLCRF